MNRYPSLLLAALALFAAPTIVHAQTVFFDDFDGNALLPHWSQPPSSHWSHSVNNSMLTVDGLFYPSASHPPVSANYAVLGAYGAYAPQTDFQLDARMGWGTGEGVWRFDLTVMINQGLVATIGYREHPAAGPPGIYAWSGSGEVTIPGPPSGMYDFRISRQGALFNFYFDGNLFASLTSQYTGPVDGVSFFFSSPYPGQSSPFHVDWVRVQIPSPGSLVAVMAGIGWSLRRRRLR